MKFALNYTYWARTAQETNPDLDYKDKLINVVWENIRSLFQQDRQCRPTCNITFLARTLNNYCRWKATSTTYSQLVFVPLVIQHAEPMRIIILSSVASTTQPYFPTYLLKRQACQKKKCYWT